MGYTEAVANQPADQFEQVIYDAATDQFTGPKPEGLPIMVGYQADGANISNGVDSDTDGLSDEVELALGTDKDKADTDGDTYGDRDELLRSFDPLVAGRAMPAEWGHWAIR